MSAAGTVTVLAAQSSRQFTATGWIIDDGGQLDITKDDEVVVASFAPGAWGAVYQDSAVRT